MEERQRQYEIWVEVKPGMDRLFNPGPFSREEADQRVERLNAASRGKSKFYAKLLPWKPTPVEAAPYRTHAPESDAAYWKATNDGTLDWRRRDILHFLEQAREPMTADDYYAAQQTQTSGYGTQFTLLRRAGYIARDGRKKTRSGSSASAYVRGSRVVGPDFGDKGHFAAYNQPLRATIREAIICIEKGDCDEARELLEELVEME